VGAGKQQLCGHDVLPYQPHVVPRGYGLEDFHGIIIELPHLFDHDDRIGPQRERVAGIHIVEAPLRRHVWGNMP
jgi:hypothetical protein